ncbi:NAD-dependent epimerase/dehydratase family protein [Amycolatopsis sp. NPDC051061]|uniref:NAD-dependent epimerase/dehydratase family protein n=1 Tax=Amycolatopsis sp. NPDC051061 TaxID=3155042 RepID=UPI0034416062
MTAGEPDILVTGATGFVGTAVLRELVGRGMGPRVRVFVRRPVPGWMTDAGVTTWRGDLTDAPGLAGACTGITMLVHLASQIGGDPGSCRAVNEEGTANLLAEARRAGTPGLLYLSTCAVYRDGEHRGAAVPGSGLAARRASAGRGGVGSAQVAELALSACGSGSAGEGRGAGSAQVAELALSAVRSGSAGEGRGAGSAQVAELALSAVRSGSAGEGLGAGSAQVAESALSAVRSGSAGEGLGAGSAQVADPAPSAARSGLGVGSDSVAGPVLPIRGLGLVADPVSAIRGGGPGERIGLGLVADLGPSTGRGVPGESWPEADLGPSAGQQGPAGEGPQGGPGAVAVPASEHPHPGAELVTDPASATSRSRLAGERLVLAAGGTVLRPHLVHGTGDRHLVPALARWIRAVPAWAAGGAARTSLVAVADLAAAIVELALNPRPAGAGEVFHVADPRPVRMRHLVTAVCELLDLPVPVADLPLAEHRARTRAALPTLTDHQYSLLTRDHWYESDRIWELTGVSPGPGFGPSLAEAAGWYRESLGLRERGTALNDG